MEYYLDVFSPETYEAYSKSDRRITGFAPRYASRAKRVEPGDKFLCYITGLSRWAGMLEVKSKSFEDKTPRFYEKDDPYIVRFKVEPIIWLGKENAIPIREDNIWNNLSITKNYKKSSKEWTGPFRASLYHFSNEDAELIAQALFRQSEKNQLYPIDEKDQKALKESHRRLDKTLNTSAIVDDDDEKDIPTELATEVRKSAQIQAILARIGEEMGFSIWIPKSDRNLVLQELVSAPKNLVDHLPLNYDEITLKTIEQIDVIWLNKRSIVRAFEIEHTTSVYSGILRMADLLALQPNMDIKLHIVAPLDRRGKVFRQLQRPVFGLLEKAPLSGMCSFISYDSVEQLSQDRHLSHLSDSVLEDYEEYANDLDNC